MSRFFPLIHNSVTVEVSLKYDQYFWFFIWNIIFVIFINIMHTIWVLNKAFELLTYFKSVFSLLLISNWYFASNGSLAYIKKLSVSGSWSIRLSNKICFSRSRTSNYLYSIWMVRNFWPVLVVLFHIFFCNIIKIKHFCIVLL